MELTPTHDFDSLYDPVQESIVVDKEGTLMPIPVGSERLRRPSSIEDRLKTVVDSKETRKIKDTDSVKGSEIKNDGTDEKETFDDILPTPKTPLDSALAWLSGSNPTLDQKERLLFITPQGVNFLISGYRIEVASAKRNTDFHELFPEIDKLDALIEDFSCAWFNDVLLQGRLYVSENHICFYSKVIWTYSLAIPIADISIVEKKTIAAIFQNSIEISTRDKKYFFASFVTRDQAYDLITSSIAGHPDNCIRLQSEIDPVPPSRRTSEANIRSPSLSSNSLVRISSTVRRSNSMGAIDTIKLKLSDNIKGVASIAENESGKGLAEITNEKTEHQGKIVHQQHHVILPKPEELLKSPAKPSLPKLPTPVHRKPFECSCVGIHEKQKPAIDEIFQLTLEDLWRVVYGHQSAISEFCSDFWKKMDYRELAFTDWVSKSTQLDSIKEYKRAEEHVTFGELQEGHKRRVEYIIALSNPMGPKQTKCNLIETVLHKSENQVCIESVSQTPDVPSGNCFQAKVRICLLYQTQNSTRMLVTSTVEYLKSTWIKMILDNEVPKGVKDSFTTLARELESYSKQSPTKKVSGSSNQPAKIVNTSPLSISPVQQQVEPPKLTMMDLILSPNARIVILVLMLILFLINLVGYFYILRLESRISALESMYKPNVIQRTEL
ncbi:hypothetical protein HDV06_001143 [Boothiomyces sp. JEL0866]|nr:hypothetical protein HDV06_001143 [Boothiomyces sp. JEL0866]